MTINTVPIKIDSGEFAASHLKRLLEILIERLNPILGSLWKITYIRTQGKYIYLSVECRLDKFDHADKAYITGLAAGFLAANDIEIL